MKSHIVYNMLTTIYIGNNCSAITEYRAQSLQIQKKLAKWGAALEIKNSCIRGKDYNIAKTKRPLLTPQMMTSTLKLQPSSFIEIPTLW